MRSSPRHDARDLAAALAQRMPALAPELLPGGRRDGPEWRCGSLAGERGQSLAVRLHGERAGVWSDFASGERGDALDLVAAVLFGGDVKAAMGWARRWLGLPDDPRAAPLPATMRRAPAPADDAAAEVEAEGRRRAARGLFGHPDTLHNIAGTPAALYLAGRGIELAELGRIPRALRFHPGVWCQEAGCPLPAMLAAIHGPDGEHVATHRTWLAEAGGVWRKAPLAKAKKVLGGFAGGTVRLWRGATGRPLREARDGEAVALAEGIETGLSVALACPELRVLAAVSLGNMGSVALPPAIRTVILCADNDGDNPAAARGLQRAVDRFAGEGREVRVAFPPDGHGDFNDALNAEKNA